MKRILSLCILFAAVQLLWAQSTVKGIVVDKATGEALIGVSVLEPQSATGTVTNMDGTFTLKLTGKATVVKLQFSYVGYTTKELEASGSQIELGTVQLDPEAIGLQDVTITSSVAIRRKTPVAVSTITPLVIEEKLGNQEFPEILKSTPGVYATKNGGGYGDSKMNLRGFQAANVAVMVNGVPVNDMEWGGVYWSNWAGLSDVTRSTQVQRGLGASKISSPSVGGSVNVLTRTTDVKRGGTLSYAMGNDGLNQILFSVSTGLSDKGWALTLLGAKRWGDGYVQGTEFSGYSYFVNISKLFNERHTLSLTAFGAPQEHYQRSQYDGLTVAGWQQVADYMDGDSPYKYNPTFGYGRNGERKTSAYNFYHKPQISLNHNWQIDEVSTLSTALYTSIGRGGGYSGQTTSAYSGAWYGSSDGTLNTKFRNSDGTFAYDQVYDVNEASTTGSQMVMSVSRNYHNWYGLLSTYTRQLNKNFELSGGVDVRYYKGVHTNVIEDLYGGNYYIDRYRASVRAENNAAAGAAGFAGQKLKVGDVVYRDYDGHVAQEGVFAQLEGTFFDKALNAFVSGSVSNTAYWRYDRFYYDADHARSETLNFWGYTVKGGANFNFANYHNVFANVGYISRAPFFSGGAFLQSTTSNMTNPDAVNEKIFSVELGYGFQWKYLSAKLNAYYTRWMDKTMARSADFSYVDGSGNTISDRYSINMSGVDAKHQGIELELSSNPTKWLELKGMVSVGNWTWDSNARGYFYNSGGQPLADTKGTVASEIYAADHAYMDINLKGVHVGGSAQTTAALGANFAIAKGLRVGADYTYFCRNYADFTISSNDLIFFGEKTYPESWKIPGAGVLDVNASYRFPIGKLNAVISGNVQNVLNQLYIADAYNGGGNDWSSAYRVFYGFGRTWMMRLKINF